MMIEKEYADKINKHEFIYIGEDYPFEAGGKYYAFYSHKWVIWIHPSSIQSNVFTHEPCIMGGSIETMKKGYAHVMDFYLSKNDQIVISKMTRQYIEGYDKLPLPQWIVKAIRVIGEKVKREEQFKVNEII